MKDFTYLRKGGIVYASGENWEYKQVGEFISFEQKGKIPSLRIVKTLIKLLNKSIEET